MDDQSQAESIRQALGELTNRSAAYSHAAKRAVQRFARGNGVAVEPRWLTPAVLSAEELERWMGDSSSPLWDAAAFWFFMPRLLELAVEGFVEEKVRLIQLDNLFFFPERSGFRDLRPSDRVAIENALLAVLAALLQRSATESYRRAGANEWLWQSAPWFESLDRPIELWNSTHTSTADRELAALVRLTRDEIARDGCVRLTAGASAEAGRALAAWLTSDEVSQRITDASGESVER